MKDCINYSLKAHNTFGIEAKCDRFLEYSSVQEAQQVAAILRASDCPFLIIGGGSNLLLTKDFKGIVVHSAIKGIERMAENADSASGNDLLVECGSGEIWDDVVAWCTSHGYGNLVNLSLIPGEVGASAVQNIGAYGSEAGDYISRIHAVEIASGEEVTISRDECQYGYRSSRFKHEWRNRYLITSVVYLLPSAEQLNIDYGNIREELKRQQIEHPTADDLRQTIINIRNAKLPDPKIEGNAGSFFMNPVVSKEKYLELAAIYPGMPHYTVDGSREKIPAGWMIDQCGWKGKSLGRAGVHGKQALVLVNRGGATGDEIVSLCDAIRKDVFAKFGIEIFPEVNII
ncbi:MAG: UDP-N-acetylmuramate dehydrogenase [Prevotella sp.]|nr:UDP-N-acetylmuramate dehydrogenase [Prevotella sp.]